MGANRRLQGELDAVMLALARWHSELQDLVDRQGLKLLQQSQAWSILTVQYLIGKIIAGASMDATEGDCEDQSEEYRNLVAVAELGLLKSPPTEEAKSFMFGSSFLPALYLTARKCRDPTIWREALELMCLTGAKEGLWYRSELMCIAARVIELEEGLAVPGSDEQPEPPNRKTVRFYDVVLALNYRQDGKTLVNITYIIYDANIDERWRFVKETLTISE